MNAVPDYDLSEELTRKSGEAYSWLENEFKRGQLSDNAYFHALMALDLALLGLIPDEYSKWAAERRKQLNHNDAGDCCAFYSDTRLVVLKLDRQRGAVRMTAIVRTAGAKSITKELTNEEATDACSWAFDRFQELRADLVKKGYVELV